MDSARRISIGFASTTAAMALTIALVIPGADAAGAKGPKPPPTSSTTTASATPPPTTSSSPSPTTTQTTPPTSTSSPSPTSSLTPTTPPGECATVTHNGLTYCTATVTEIARGLRPVGQRVALLAVPVDDVSGSVAYIYSLDDCPPGQYCGATVTAIAVDMAPLGRTPDAWSTINLYGEVVDGGTVTPHDWVSAP